MKALIAHKLQKFLNRLGYRFVRYSPSDSADYALVEIARLVSNIPEPIIFDVGAHVGNVSKTFRKLIPNSRIYSFEPFPESFEALKYNCGSDPRTTLFNFGLSDMDGVYDFHSNGSDATNSLLETDKEAPSDWTEPLSTKEVIKLPMRTLDSVLKELSIPKVDVLKLDVQGAEYLVMKGARSACENGQIALIYAEIITRPSYKGQKLFDESLRDYREHGFDLYNLYHLSCTDDNIFAQTDALFYKQGDPTLNIKARKPAASS